jgi:trimeric autotransporter adhesin
MNRTLPFVFIMVCISTFCYGQISGLKTVGGISPDYLTLSAAIADLNSNGVAFGGVTFNIAAGHTETAANLIITTTTGADTSPIVFQKSGIGANPLITASAGTSTSADGIIKIAGTDYITFNGIDLKDPTTNTTTTTRMEWGFAIVKGSATNGSQHITISNCTVTLQKAYASTKAIYSGNHIATSTSALTITSQSGTNSYIDIYNNTLSNCYVGIYMAGSSNATYYDDSLRVGTYGGNVITNFGGTSTIAYGIYMQYFRYAEIMNDSITGGTGTTRDLNGIYVTAGTNCNALIQNNYVQINFSPSSYDGYGIYYAAGGNANTVVLNNNTVKNCTMSGSISDFFSIWISTLASTTISNNTVGSNTTSVSIGDIYQIYVALAPVSLTINNNSILSNQTTPGTGGASYGIYATGSGAIYNNTISGNINSGTNGSYYPIYANAGGTLYGNNLYNNSAGSSSSACYGIYTTGGNASLYQNSIHNQSTGGSGVVQGITLAGVANAIYEVYQNKIYELGSTSNSSLVSGIVQSGLSNSTIDNNVIGLLSSGSGTTQTNGINGINITSSSTGSVSNIYHNSIYLNATSTGGTNCIFLNVATAATVLNNVLVNVSMAGTTLNRAACLLKRSGTNFATYQPESDNNLYSLGNIPGIYRYVYTDGSISHQSLSQFQFYATNQEQSSISQNVSFASIVGSASNFLQPLDTTYTESNGKIIPGLVRDYSGISSRTTFPLIAQLNSGGLAPDIGAYESDNIFIDVLPPSINFTPLTKSIASGSRLIENVAITDASGVNVSFGSAPRLYYKKSTDANVLAASNSSFDNGWKYVETPNFTYPFTFTIDYSNLYLTGAVADGDIIQYFIVAQDYATTPQVGCKGASLASPASSVVLTTTQFPVTIGFSYTVKASGIPAFLSVGSGGTYPNFTLPGGLFEAINNGIITNDVTVIVLSDISGETGAIPLNKFTEEGFGAGSFTISIQPSSAFPLTITGTNTTGGLLKFVDVNRVTIDGSFSGSGRYLNFVNQAASGNNAVLQLVGSGTSLGCNNINIKNCTIWTDTAYLSGNNGIVIGGSTIGISTGAQQGINNRNITLSNNSISRAYNGIMVNGNAAFPATNISILNNEIGHDSSTKYIGMNGIFMRGVSNSNISGNKIFNIINSLSNVMTGINCDQDVTQTRISGNRISKIMHTANTSVAVYGIYSKTVTNNNLTISNNAISQILGQGAATDITTGPVGIYLNNGDNSKIINNSVILSGDRLDNSVGGAYTSCLYVRNTVANLIISNNIFKNVMTSSNTIGAGSNFAIVTGSNNVNSFAVLNNNLYLVGSTTPGMANALALTGTTMRTDLNAWRQFSLLDKNSLWGEPGYIADSIVEPNPFNVNSWNINGRGYPMANVNSDILNNSRSTSIATGSTDIGAFEMTPSVPPPYALASSTPAAGTTTYYTVANDTVASIVWQPTSNIPLGLTVQYYSGSIPPSPSITQYMNAYWDIQSTSSSGIDCALNLFYKPEAMYKVSSEAALIVAQKDGSNPWFPFTLGTSSVDTIKDRMTVPALTSFSIFTGTDVSSPLPVELLSFTGKALENDVQLSWITASEIDFELFTIECSYDGKAFKNVGNVRATGTTSQMHHYQFLDKGMGKQLVVYYRLHLQNLNGTYSYSNTIRIDNQKSSTELTFDVFPNPFAETIFVNVNSVENRTLILKDITGKTILEQQISTPGIHQLVLPQQLNAGIYFLQDRLSGRSIKLIKSN